MDMTSEGYIVGIEAARKVPSLSEDQEVYLIVSSVNRKGVRIEEKKGRIATLRKE